MSTSEAAQETDDAIGTKSLLDSLEFIKYDFYIDEVKPSNIEFPANTMHSQACDFSDFGLRVIEKFLHIGLINESTFIEQLDSNRVLLVVWPSFVSPAAYAIANQYSLGLERVKTIMFIVPESVFHKFSAVNVPNSDIVLSTAALTSSDEWKTLEGLVVSSLCNLMVDRTAADSFGDIDTWNDFPADKLNTAMEQIFFICCGKQRLALAVEKLLQRNWYRIVACSLDSEEAVDREESFFVESNLIAAIVSWSKSSLRDEALMTFLNDVNSSESILEPDEILEIGRIASAKHIANTKRFQCGQCIYQTNVGDQFKRHLRSHTGEKPYKCSECLKMFADRATLKIHRIIHSGVYSYICEFCGKAFYNSHRLKQHNIYYHSSDPKFQCYACDSPFQNKDDLKEHITVHANIEQFQCMVCLRRFPSESKLKKHSRVHTDERPFKCDVCGGGFLHKHHLVEHSTLHTDVPMFGCEICEKKFKQKTGLRKHRIMIHSACRSMPS